MQQRELSDVQAAGTARRLPSRIHVSWRRGIMNGSSKYVENLLQGLVT
jgi:hypothetical protein